MTITTYGQVRSGTYRIDPARSQLSFTLRNFLGIFPIRGTFAVREGVVEVAATPTGTTVRAVVDAASFRSGIAKRDADVCSRRFLDVERFPDLVFTGRAVGDGTSVVGHVDRHGSMTEVTLELAGAESIEDGYLVTATARVDRCALGVTGARPAGRFIDLDLRIVLM